MFNSAIRNFLWIKVFNVPEDCDKRFRSGIENSLENHVNLFFLCCCLEALFAPFKIEKHLKSHRIVLFLGFLCQQHGAFKI